MRTWCQGRNFNSCPYILWIDRLVSEMLDRMAFFIEL